MSGPLLGEAYRAAAPILPFLALGSLALPEIAGVSLVPRGTG